MKEIPIISIFMITYNHEKFIAEAIEGVLMQQANFKFKLFITDDCSSDKTSIICKQYAEKYPELVDYELLNPNIGAIQNATYCLNKCINSNTKYIALCEGDDFWTDPLKLQKQVDFLDKNKKYSGCFHETYDLKVNSDFSENEQLVWRKTLKKQLTIEDLFLNKYCLFHTSSFVFKNNLFVLPDWFSQISSGDLALFYIVAGHGPIGKVNGVMSVYRQHEGGISNTKEHNENLVKNRTKLLELIDQYYNYKYTSNINRIIVAFKTNTPIKLPLSYRLKNKILRLFN